MLFLINNTFIEVKQSELYKAKFIAKEREQLTTNTLIKFNRGLI